MIEHGHLRIVDALERCGTLTEAARQLHLTQPALTHQIRALEQRLGVRLWQRDGRRLRLTEAGRRLLETARHVLPVLQQAEQQLKALAAGREGLLRIGVECFPCYRWLTGVIGEFLQRQPGVDVDIVNRFRFDGLTGLLHRHVDVLVTPDRVEQEGIVYHHLADYRQVLLCRAGSELAQRSWIEPGDLAGQILFSFPVPRQRLDVFTRFLQPAGQAPAAHKPLESLELMLQMTALGRGVCVLPAWLARPQVETGELAMVDLGREGLHGRLYLARRADGETPAYLERFIELGREMARSAFREGAVAPDGLSSRG